MTSSSATFAAPATVVASSTFTSPTRDSSGEEKCCDSKSCCHGEETTCSKSFTSTAAGTSGITPCCHETPEHNSAVCLAVIRENGTDVVIFDASGVPRTFTYQGDIRKLCFSTHGWQTTTTANLPTNNQDQDADDDDDAPQVDDLLTPCFDQQGNHGDPGESCRFCDVETPHLHAHVHDPQTCHPENSSVSLRGAKSNKMDGMGFLATQILLPIPEDATTSSSKGNQPLSSSSSSSEKPLLDITVSKQMPKECNSRKVMELKQQPTSSSTSEPRWYGRRLFKVKHDDHFDYLVHNKQTGQLHLEHPCDACGKDDIHGRFRNVAQRSLRRRTKDHDHRHIPFHIFEIEKQKPFNVLEFMSELFTTTSDRVAAVENMMMEHSNSNSNANSRRNSGVGMTTTAAAATTPTVAAVLTSRLATGLRTKDTALHQPGDGAAMESPSPREPGSLATNERKKMDCATMAVEVDLEAGDRKNESARLETSGAQATVNSKFSCSGICCAKEIPLVHGIINPLPGVKSIKINVPLKQVLVDHDPSVTTATDVEKALNDNLLNATILRDGGATANRDHQQQTAGRSQFYVQHICCASEIPAIHSILDPLNGITAVSINVTNKLVYVDHSFLLITADEITSALNEQGFGAETRVDGAKVASTSSLFVQSILSCDYEKQDHDHHDHNNPSDRGDCSHKDKCNNCPTTLALTEFLRSFETSQIESFVVDVPQKTISVVHCPFNLSAQDIAKALQEQTGFVTVVTRDGADFSNWNMPSFGDADDKEAEEEDFTYPRPSVILSGIFWVISMLYLVGGWWYVNF